jgi:hypothetical protein
VKKVIGVAHLFRKITPKRPMVIRNKNTVKVCFLWQGIKECLGPLCYWQKVGRCPIYIRLRKKEAAAK